MVLATHDLNLAASLCDTLVLVREGRVLMQGPTREVLTSATVEQLYGVIADVTFHERAGHLTVIPVRRAMSDVASRSEHGSRDRSRPIRTRLAITLAGFGALTVADLSCWRRSSAARTSAWRARSIDRFRSPTTSTRRSSSSPGCRACSSGALVGAALATAGVVFQALLRNPLATPFTLGVSAGASLGAMLVIIFGVTFSAGPFSAVPLASFAGAAVATGIVYWLATPYRRAMSTAVLLLAGVTLNSFFSALIMFVQYVADFAQAYRAARWLMGDLDVGSFEPVVAAVPLVVVAFAIFAVLPSSLNVLSLGPGCRRHARRRCRPRAAAGVLQRLSRHQRGGLARRADRLRRHRRAASGPTDRRRRPSHRAAGVSVVRRSVSRGVRPGRADAARARRDSRRRRHRNDRRAVLPMAARAKKLIRCLDLVLSVGAGPSCPAVLTRFSRAALLVACVATTRAAQQRRIVSLVPALTEMLFAIGAGPQVVGVGSFDAFPPEVKNLPRVGALLDPDIGAHPVAPAGRSSSPTARRRICSNQFARAGITTYVYRHGGIDTILQTMRELGDATGHRQRSRPASCAVCGHGSPPSARGRRAARSRACCWSSIASRRHCARSTSAAGVGFLHEMLEIAGGTQRLLRRHARVGCSHRTKRCIARAPDVIVELQAEGMIATGGCRGRRRRCGRHCRRCRPSATAGCTY